MKKRTAYKLILLIFAFLIISCSCGLPKMSEIDKISDLLPGGGEGEEARPEVEKPAAEEPVQVWVRQWAATAKASSEYGNPDWAASQATGAPDTPDCGDYETAWASEEKFSVDWLEVGYEATVYPTEINIYESHTPTQIVKVEILDDMGNYHEVYTGTPQGTSCPYILKVSIQDAAYQAAAVKITVDQSHLDLPWDEIDAVELVGYTASGSVQTNETETESTTSEQPSGEAPVDGEWGWEYYTSADGLPDDNVQALAVSRDGTVWVGMKKGGVSRFYGGQFENFTIEDGIGSDNAKGILVAPDGKVWAGTAAGLSVYDGSTWATYTTDDGLVNNIVNAIALAEDGSIWIATESGISYYDHSTWTNYSPDDGPGKTNVKGVAIATNGDVWFATFNGVSRFDGANWDYFNIEDGLSLDVFTAVGADPDGSVWLGTSGEAADRFDGNSFSSFKSEMGPTVYVSAITVGLDGVMWFGTEGDGVFRYDGQTWMQFLKGDSGLAYNWVDAAAVAPDGALWFATRKNGITRFGP